MDAKSPKGRISPPSLYYQESDETKNIIFVRILAKLFLIFVLDILREVLERKKFSQKTQFIRHVGKLEHDICGHSLNKNSSAQSFIQKPEILFSNQIP